MMCVSRLAFVALSIAATGVHAQSTSRVGEAARPLRVEVSVGLDRQRDYFGSPGTVTSAAVAVRWTPSTLGGLRATVHGIRRYDEYVMSYGADRDSVESEDRLLAFTLSTDLSIRIWRDLTLAPSVGAGFTPWVHGRMSTIRVRALPDNTPNDYGNYSRSDVGVIWTTGLALRYRHLVIEKQAIGLLGAENAVRFGREYYPWTIGYRF
jgi:hypothetical protein